jgi:Ca-activated chloride channel family protein
MNLKNFLFVSVIAFSLIATLSSFYKKGNSSTTIHSSNEILADINQIPQDERYLDDDKKYNSTNKQQKSDNAFTLGTAFQNDYYSNEDRGGYFYQELKAEKYKNLDAKRTPLNISIVIDKSGSMAGDKIRNVRKAAKEMIDQMTSDDYVSIVIYDSEVDVLHESQRLTNKEIVKNKIDKIVDRSGTNLCGGMQRGYKEVARTYKSGFINRVLLLSDGLANEGITNSKEIESITRKHLQNEQISISTFGVGNDYNEDLMTALAENGSGNYYFINKAQDVASILRKELNGMMEVIAHHVVLKINIPDNVTIVNVKGANFIQVGREITINLHDVFSEETKGILVHYRINSKYNEPNKFYTSLNYKEASTNYTKTMNIVNTQEYTNNKMAYMQHYNEWVDAQVALNVINVRMEEAARETDKGNYSQARKLVKDNNDYISSKKKLVEKNVELQKVSESNAAYDYNLTDAENMAPAALKTMQKESKEGQYKSRNKK